MFRIMEKMITGNVHHEDIDKLLNVTKQIEGHTICALRRCCCLAHTRIDETF